MALLLLVLVPGIGRKVGGARRWLSLGPLRFQPSELFKLAAVLFAADRLATALDEGFGWREALPRLLPLGLGMLLILVEPDFGSTVLTGMMLTGLLFVAGMPTRWLGWVIAGAIPNVAHETGKVKLGGRDLPLQASDIGLKLSVHCRELFDRPRFLVLTNP